MTLQTTATRLAEPIGITYATRTVDFRKKLAALCATKTPRQEIMTITPAMGTIMLERKRENNRAIQDRLVVRYATEMREDRWTITNQGIGFDSNGHLCDGQHRLSACVMADVPFTSWVAFGLAPENFKHIDIGSKRTNGQLFQIAGLPNGNILSAAARLAYLYETKDITLSSTRVGIAPKSAVYVSNDLLMDFVAKNPSFADTTTFNRLYREFSGLEYSSSHALHWITRQAYPRKADEFFERLCSGTGLIKGDPIHRLRHRLEQIRARRERVPKAWKAAWVIKAFNAWNAGKTLEQFKIGTSELFPRVK